MKKILKKEVIIAFILGAILTGGIVYAATSASQVTYTTSKNGNVQTVADALNDLYKKSNKTPQQVATLTTQGASYTMQNDGYITGTINSSYNMAAGAIYFNTCNQELIDEAVCYVPSNVNTNLNTSIYVPKNTTVHTRTSWGTYNLTVYEWK